MNTPYNFLDTAILAYGPVQLLGDIIILHTDQDIIFAHVCQIIRGKPLSVGFSLCRCCQNDAQLLGECSWVTHIASMMTGKLHDGCSDAICQEGGDPVR